MNGMELISGYDVGYLPPTPLVPFIDDYACEVARTALLGAVNNYGIPVGYLQEQKGAVIQHVVPNPKTEYLQMSSSSKVDLALHTETAFHPYKPDFVFLFCLRGDENAVTTYALLSDIIQELDEVCIDLLHCPMYLTSVDESFRTNGEPDITVNTSVLYETIYGTSMCYDKTVMVGTTVAAQEALEEFGRAVEKHTKEVVLKEGDLLILDNAKAVHGRKPFQARYDGTDRWLMRTLVRRFGRPLPKDVKYCPTTGFPVIQRYYDL